MVSTSDSYADEGDLEPGRLQVMRQAIMEAMAELDEDNVSYLTVD